MSDWKHAPHIEIEQLRAEVRALSSQIEQLRRQRYPKLTTPRQVRLAITTTHPVNGYPAAVANTFPIRFVDPHFDPTGAVQQDATATPRSVESISYAHSVTGDYIPVGTVIPVFEQRGLGPAGSGEYWILDQPKRYFGKAVSDIARNGSGTLSIWMLDESDAWFDTEIWISVRDWFMRFAETGTIIPGGSGLAVDWYFNRWVIAEVSCLPDDFFD